MPFPFILVGIGIAVVTALVGTTIVKWDAIVIALQGKKLAVLGERGVGKTHLISFLTSGSLPAEYKQTLRQRRRRRDASTSRSCT